MSRLLLPQQLLLHNTLLESVICVKYSVFFFGEGRSVLPTVPFEADFLQLVLAG